MKTKVVFIAFLETSCISNPYKPKKKLFQISVLLSRKRHVCGSQPLLINGSLTVNSKDKSFPLDLVKKVWCPLNTETDIQNANTRNLSSRMECLKQILDKFILISLHITCVIRYKWQGILGKTINSMKAR